MCFHNVREAVEKHGGSAVHGWLIWEWEQACLEAEHHAVWCQDGDLVDITPHEPGQRTILFLPDPERTFDFEHRRRLDNRRIALRGDATVKEYLSLSAELVAIEEASDRGGEIVLTPEQATRFEWIMFRLRQCEHDFALRSIARLGRNDPCYCGSGRKHKSCCDAGAPHNAGQAGR